jgi:hypothetical protein
MNIEVIDRRGSLLYNQVLYSKAGTHVLDLDGSQFKTPGIYFVRINADQKTTALKVVKE